MNAHTEFQIIEHNGSPAFVLVPYDQFLQVRPFLDLREKLRGTIPHAIVEANLLHDVPIIKAWREYLGLTQEQLATKAGMKQSALARIESGLVTPRRSTINKLATALGVMPELLAQSDTEEAAQAA